MKFVELLNVLKHGEVVNVWTGQQETNEEREAYQNLYKEDFLNLEIINVYVNDEGFMEVRLQDLPKDKIEIIVNGVSKFSFDGKIIN